MDIYSVSSDKGGIAFSFYTLVLATMAFMGNHARIYSTYSKARLEAYGGLFLLLLGVTILTFRQCPSNGEQNHRVAALPPQTGGGELPSSVGIGNARQDSQSSKGWWVGHFAAEGTAQYSRDVETKWASHHAGAKHEGWASNQVATTMAVLVSGRHRVEFVGSHVVLENRGDYVIWGPGIPHSWTALEDSTLLCVRWPSLAGDQDGVRNSSVLNSTASFATTSSHVQATAPDSGFSAAIGD